MARVNTAAIERNCARLRDELKGGAELCAVVKADGYGHGAVQSARAALAGGASWLAVAGAAEAKELREAGLREVRLLVMGALSEVELREALAADGDVVVWNERQVEAVSAAGGGRVHVKLDSGMGRLGTRDPAQASRAVAAARATEGVELAGVMTHFATADDLDDNGFFAAQFGAFTEWARPLKAEQPELIVHAANSAAVLREAARALRHGALRDRCLRDGPVRRGSGDTGPGAGARAELVCGRGEAISRGGERRVWAALRGRAGHLARGAPDRLRGWLAARLVEQRRGADRRQPLPSGGHREHGQSDGRSRARAGRGDARRAGDPDRRCRRRRRHAGRGADHRRGGGAAAGDDQLRGDVRADTPRAAVLSPRRRSQLDPAGGSAAPETPSTQSTAAGRSIAQA